MHRGPRVSTAFCPTRDIRSPHLMLLACRSETLHLERFRHNQRL
jgi:hypothetical protein